MGGKPLALTLSALSSSFDWQLVTSTSVEILRRANIGLIETYIFKPFEVETLGPKIYIIGPHTLWDRIRFIR